MLKTDTIAALDGDSPLGTLVDHLAVEGKPRIPGTRRRIEDAREGLEQAEEELERARRGLANAWCGRNVGPRFLHARGAVASVFGRLLGFAGG